MIQQVVVGIIRNPHGQVLIQQRPEGKDLAGYWEFPGGKVEAYETLGIALIREIQEELGLTVRPVRYLMVSDREYPHGKFRVHFMECIGEGPGACELVSPKEGQEFRWVELAAISRSLEPMMLADDMAVAAAMLDPEKTTGKVVVVRSTFMLKNLQRPQELVDIENYTSYSSGPFDTEYLIRKLGEAELSKMLANGSAYWRNDG